ncbi:unnamed protein product [Didymodactylos carnosus]|uniref:Uncharacterized protein n=1 Tax=Didymodactylos carnosus TaxID=1234261 RepID=A0A815NWR7_9BILA|nr:unnamed protein product [Didymodactylos carnosus]CAF1435797.1 unnamed protein product [Didymodactylos carnosus]CAF3950747.1 unnamed protein product [Didymodactylos carnosus]CAF4313382.1 unnamed protein product [Didymodactylos carnosus]
MFRLLLVALLTSTAHSWFNQPWSNGNRPDSPWFDSINPLDRNATSSSFGDYFQNMFVQMQKQFDSMFQQPTQLNGDSQDDVGDLGQIEPKCNTTTSGQNQRYRTTTCVKEVTKNTEKLLYKEVNTTDTQSGKIIGHSVSYSKYQTLDNNNGTMTITPAADKVITY